MTVEHASRTGKTYYLHVKTTAAGKPSNVYGHVRRNCLKLSGPSDTVVRSGRSVLGLGARGYGVHSERTGASGYFRVSVA